MDSLGEASLDGPRAFQFQICGWLFTLRNTDVILDTVKKSFEDQARKLYLVPACSFFFNLNSAQILEILTGGFCRHTACFPCRRYIAAGGGIS